VTPSLIPEGDEDVAISGSNLYTLDNGGTIGKYTLVPNAFWGGAGFPLAVFAILFLWPSLERRFTAEQADAVIAKDAATQ